MSGSNDMMPRGAPVPSRETNSRAVSMFEGTSHAPLLLRPGGPVRIGIGPLLTLYMEQVIASHHRLRRRKEGTMWKGLILWMLGVPGIIVILLYFFGIL